jgi:erythromycin esterase-like protein
MNDAEVIAAIRPALQPLTGAMGDLDSLMDLIGDARFVLIGEASHGTHEFYSIRAKITRRLIREKGFNAVAVEADWPDADRINRFVRGESDDAEAIDARATSSAFRRGCGATPTCSTSSAGCATTTTARPTKSASTASTSTASTPRWPR